MLRRCLSVVTVAALPKSDTNNGVRLELMMSVANRSFVDRCSKYSKVLLFSAIVVCPPTDLYRVAKKVSNCGSSNTSISWIVHGLNGNARASYCPVTSNLSIALLFMMGFAADSNGG